MSYLLRIIDQNLSQCEEQKNFSLEAEDYTVLIKVENNCIDSGETKFEKVLREYREEYPIDSDTLESIIGFVFGKNRIHPIRTFEVAFIVNSEGKTLERIYGHYNKY